jgi:hypothetical protein
MYAVYMKNSMQNRTYIAMFKINYIYIYVYVEHQVSRCMFHFGFIVVNYLYIYMTVRGYNYALVLFKNPLVKK